MKPLLLLAAAALALAACQPQPAESPENLEAGTASPIPPPSGRAALPTPAPAPAPTDTRADAGTRDEEKAARGVLLEWARSLELGQLDRAWATWGDDAATRSGMTRAEHAAFWHRFKTVTIAMPTGTLEGAAGSLYYTAPTTVVGKTAAGMPYRLEGKVVLRRVNDVPGATANQLKWHIEQVDLK